MTTSTQEHTSIPLIYLSSQTQPKFVLNPKAIQLIQSYGSSNQMTFISICGDYRSGKSFLMNSLFFSKQGFKVSPTIQPCTKGINLWSKPMSSNGKNIWILDTQGFGAIDRDDSYDVKIFLLTTLISDIVMYNSFGALDQNTINKFAAICHKAESLDHGLKAIKMFWVLRDFSLSIQNKEGRVLTANQYLQSALDDSLSSSPANRQAIKRVFGQRHCIPLVRPVIDEKILSQLSQIKFQQLRGEFVQQVYKLRKKLLSCIQSKVIEGVKIDGENLGMFVNKYLEALNMNQMETDISSTWEKIVQYEKEKVEGKVRGRVRDVLVKEMEKIPFTVQGLVKIIQQDDKLIQQQLKQYSQHFMNKQFVNSSQLALKQYVSEMRGQLIQKNIEFLRNQQKKTVKGIFQNVQKQVGKQSKAEDSQLIQKYLEKLFKTKDQYITKFGKFMSGEKDKKAGSGKGNNNSTKQLQHLLNTITNHQQFQLSLTKPQLLRLNDHLSQSSQLIYYQHFYHQQKLMFPKIVGQLSQQLASTIGKINQMRKVMKTKDIDIKVLSQQREKLTEDITQLNKEINKIQGNRLELSKQLELKQHELVSVATKSDHDYLQIKSQYQQNIQQLKQTILSLEKNFLSLQKQNQLQILQFQDKITHLNQKNQLLTQKFQQNKLLHQSTIIQLKQQHEQKLRKQQDKYSELQNNLNQQRKKFLQLNKNKKQQQSQLLQDLAEKNEKLLSLRRQITSIEHIYKEQLDSLLNEQKASLQKQFMLQFEQKQHLLNVLQQKLQHCMIRIQQLQDIEKKYETLLMQHRLITEEHLNVVDKYKEIHNKLKKNTQADQQKETLFEEIKENYQNQLKSKDDMLRKFKMEIKNTHEEKTKTIQQMQMRHINQINQVRSAESAVYEQKLRVRLSELQSNHKAQKGQLLQQLKQSFNEIQGLKSIRQRQQSELRYFTQTVVGLLKEYKVMEKEIRQVMRKYKKIQHDGQLLANNNNNNKQNNKGDNLNNSNNHSSNKHTAQNILPSQLDKIDENNSMMQQSSSMLTQSMGMMRDDSSLSTSMQSRSGYITRQAVQQLQSHFLLVLQSNKSLTEQLQDLKHSFKQTIQQLQSCQLHINKLNTRLSAQDQQLTGLSTTVNQLQQTKKELHQKSIKLQSLEKTISLLKKQVQLRDEIYMKRQSSIKQNLQLYKETIANLTQQNQHLTQKSTKLQIQLNRFAQWQADLTIYNQNRTKSNLGSFDFMTENIQQTDDINSFGDKISKLEKENRKLRKQLNQQKQLVLNNTFKPPGTAANSLTTILIDTNNTGQIESLKKQNLTYKKRVDQLRQRQLKLLQEIKSVKASEKQSSETKVNLVRQQFQSYRKKSKQEVVELEKRIDELMQEKYKLKQEMLVIKQDRSSYAMYGGGKGMSGDGIGLGTGSNNYSSNNYNNNYTDANYQRSASSIRPYMQSQTIIQPYLKTIDSLKQQNSKLQLQVSTLNAQLVKLKDESDKKLASLQVFYEDQIRQLEQEKSRIDLQNEKNKTKYEHLLKVNNQLIIQVDNSKAKANNQLTLKEKYKNKISALFNDD